MDHVFGSNCSYWEAHDSKNQHNLLLWFVDWSLVRFHGEMLMHGLKTEGDVVPY